MRYFIRVYFNSLNATLVLLNDDNIWCQRFIELVNFVYTNGLGLDNILPQPFVHSYHEVQITVLLTVLYDHWLWWFLVVPEIVWLRNFVLGVLQFELFHVGLDLSDINQDFFLFHLLWNRHYFWTAYCRLLLFCIFFVICNRFTYFRLIMGIKVHYILFFFLRLIFMILIWFMRMLILLRYWRTFHTDLSFNLAKLGLNSLDFSQ